MNTVGNLGIHYFAKSTTGNAMREILESKKMCIHILELYVNEWGIKDDIYVFCLYNIWFIALIRGNLF